MNYDVKIEQIGSTPLAVVRRQAKLSELSNVVPESCGIVWSLVKKLGISGAGRHVAVYLDDVMNLEIGVELAEPTTTTGELIASATPAGRVATVAHIGPYQRLSEAHNAIHQYCKTHGITLVRPCWEVYGHWTEDESKLRTDVFYLMK